MDKIKDFIKQKKIRDWAIIGATGAVILGGVLYTTFQAKNKSSQVVGQQKPVIASTVDHRDLQDYFTNKINKKIDLQSKNVKEMNQSLETINQSQEKIQEEQRKQAEDLQDEIKNLKDQLAEIKTSQSNPLPPLPQPQAAYNGLPPASQMGQMRGTTAVNAQGFSKEASSIPDSMSDIETIDVGLESTVNSKSFYRSTNDTVPAGTVIKGVILGGIDAPSEVYGPDEKTRVVTIRLISEGKTPNGHSVNLKNCTVLAGAWGDISSERVGMHAERLTCVNKAGDILETEIKGVVYGPDGRQNVRGTVYYPESKMVQRAFWSGLASGIGDGIRQSYTTNSISALGATSTPDNGHILQYGGATGASKGLDKLSDYYIKRAEQLQPVVQVGAGTEIDLVITEGFFQDGRDHTDLEQTKTAPKSLLDKSKLNNTAPYTRQQRANRMSQIRQEVLQAIDQVPGEAR